MTDYLADGPNRYQPPTPGDVRGPCPGLNSLANHGYLNRSGRNITFVDAVKGCFDGLGVSPEVSGISAFNVLRVASTLFHPAFQFDLRSLGAHYKPIEHDVSFSREDDALGDRNVFDPRLWGSVLRLIGRSYEVTPEMLGRAKDMRFLQQKAKSPKIRYDVDTAKLGGTEVGMLLTAGFTKLPWIRSLFEQERLPSHLGWQRTRWGTNIISTVTVAHRSLRAQRYIPAELRSKLDGPLDQLVDFLFPERNMTAVYKRAEDSGFGELRRLTEMDRGCPPVPVPCDPDRMCCTYKARGCCDVRTTCCFPKAPSCNQGPYYGGYGGYNGGAAGGGGGFGGGGFGGGGFGGGGFGGRGFGGRGGGGRGGGGRRGASY
ncbi:hypothetical protein GQ602_004444 [Ophiocordyceps camponoti-floridani]|uniref:Heme haloperoxidase family profile domain-containing protein n=1 Tax=Ophiocordyceps camponoti-floridani TaxID=2030778 RepID=A0A8H4VDJ6_9HYPO|nr:hypothetical protein GQ602_004444 [Ophiocordyceps camponoti-floridani]